MINDTNRQAGKTKTDKAKELMEPCGWDQIIRNSIHKVNHRHTSTIKYPAKQISLVEAKEDGTLCLEKIISQINTHATQDKH